MIEQSTASTFSSEILEEIVVNPTMSLMHAGPKRATLMSVTRCRSNGFAFGVQVRLCAAQPCLCKYETAAQDGTLHPVQITLKRPKFELS